MAGPGQSARALLGWMDVTCDPTHLQERSGQRAV
jgi:hypothetical protein